jgi:hypothetical protein
MHRSIRNSVLLCGVLMTAAMARAQKEHPYVLPGATSADVAVTYNLERAKISSSNCGCFWMNGASAEGALNFRHGLGAVALLGGATASNIEPGVDLNKVTYLFGPRYSYDISHYAGRLARGRSSHLFGELLLGGTHGFSSSFPTPNGLVTSANSFAMQLGGGLDVAAGRGFGVRALELDYIRTNLPNSASNSQNDLRIAFGLTYHSGKK